jgi:hypothetical protein
MPADDLSFQSASIEPAPVYKAIDTHFEHPGTSTGARTILLSHVCCS